MGRLGFLAGLLLVSVACRSGWDNGVHVYNGQPAVTITEPYDDSTFAQGQAITFRAVVTDDGGIDALDLQWHSAIDGVISSFDVPDAAGNVQLVTASLSIGNHVVTLRAIDEQAASAEDQITIHIEGIPEIPSIQIEHPLPGEVGVDGQLYRFMVRVDDAQDARTDLVVTLASDLYGFVCSAMPDSIGIAYCEEILPMGDHLLTFEVEDTDGYRAKATTVFPVRSLLDIDSDGDGFTPNEGDCDDADKATYPGAKEICDGKDNDCNIATPIDVGTECYDDDGDGYTENEGDCDDSQASINPGATEIPDGRDNDCDGLIDEGTGRWDHDGDGYCATPPCSNAAGTLPDCNDDDYLVNPGAKEVCNDGIDNDCDGSLTKKDAIGCSKFWKDADGDTYGVPGPTECHCEGGEHPYTGVNDKDCYDNNANAFPGQTQFFETHRGDGSYDYNCDFGETLRYIDNHVCNQSWAIICDETAGWQGGVPACGATATWIGDCTVSLKDPFACAFSGICEFTCVQKNVVGKTQACR